MPPCAQDPPRPESALKINPWTLVPVLMAFCFISHINRASITVAANHGIMEKYHFDTVQMGFIYSSFLFVYTLFMIPGGFWIDRAGVRKAMMMMGLGSALFGALTGAIGFGMVIAGNALVTFMIIRGLMGFFTTPLHPGAATAVGIWMQPNQRNRANGLITCAALLGIALNYRLVGALIKQVGWPTMFVILAVITIGVTSAWLLLTRNLPKKQIELVSAISKPAPSISWRLLLENRSLLFLTLSYAAIGYFQYLFFYWMEYYFENILKLGEERSQYYAGIPPLLMAIGMALGGTLTDWLQTKLGLKKGRASVPIGGFILSGLFLLAGVFASQTFWIVFWFSVALGILGAAEAAFWSSAVEIGRERGGTAAAIMNTGGNAGGMLAPILTPLLSKYFGWGWGIGVGSVVCLLGALCWLRIDPNEKS